MYLPTVGLEYYGAMYALHANLALVRHILRGGGGAGSRRWVRINLVWVPENNSLRTII